MVVIRRATIRGCLLWTTAIATLGTSGCDFGVPRTYPVTGRVEFSDGQPLTTGGVVLFEASEGEGTPVTARGAIREDGTFDITTYREGDGAVPGEHRVLVRAKRDPSEYLEQGITPRPVIDPRFETYETSELQFTVGESDNTFKIVVERPT